MKIAISNSNDPFYNLSLEETILKDGSNEEDILLLYINDNTIVFGRNQNLHEEINRDYVKKEKIKLVRRVSGGGAVYHDFGNLNFSFITKKEKNSYQKFLNPIINFLKSMGLDAQFKGRNDLSIDGIKISGNAQYIYKDRMFHHGTLLFDTDLSVLSKALKVNALKLESKSIKSARQRVENINNLLVDKISIEEFKNKLISYFIDNNEASLIDLAVYKNDEIKALMNIRESNDWIYNKNPDFNVQNEKRFNGGTILVMMKVEKNKINEISFSGDFLSVNDFEEIYIKFIGVDFESEEIRRSIDSITNFNDYFGSIKKEELLLLMMGEEC